MLQSPALNASNIVLMAEEGASLSRGSLRLYAQLVPNVDDQEPRMVGSIELYAYDPINHRAAVCIMVSQPLRRQGYGTAMLKALDIMAINTFKLHQLYCDIAVLNRASMALFTAVGYEQCGLMRQWVVVANQYTDCVRMQRLLQ
ncbi:MAG: GNAT family N-acetyltransferase [Bacteroidales bacterium]|nr:GNAT family N-acetyltransferase [Bacteroidales bacterium]